MTITSCGQKAENQLIGTWERVEEVKKVPQIKIGGNNTIKKIEVLLHFNEGKNVTINQGPRIYEENYKLESNNLTLGSRKYQILKLDSDSLIMTKNSGWQQKTIRYFRTSKSIKKMENNGLQQ
jgi:hypothetical protein